MTNLKAEVLKIHNMGKTSSKQTKTDSFEEMVLVRVVLIRCCEIERIGNQKDVTGNVVKLNGGK